jgi:tRNA(Arg) A34 adenosine deaminase TadA
VTGLDHAWDRALDLAWDAFCAGTTPVGAVVIDAAGAIVAEGRGRRYEPAAPPGQLAGTHVAHAELNALAQLGADRHYEDHALLTTLEPCGMCHGAAIQASIGAPVSRVRPIPPAWRDTTNLVSPISISFLASACKE